MGDLPKRRGDRCRAGLHGKLGVALRLDRRLDTGAQVSPWGYALAGAPQSLAGSPLPGPRTGGGHRASPRANQGHPTREGQRTQPRRLAQETKTAILKLTPMGATPRA